nr:hypothetical protein [uncultured Undibacterium sp.]
MRLLKFNWLLDTSRQQYAALMLLMPVEQIERCIGDFIACDTANCAGQKMEKESLAV